MDRPYFIIIDSVSLKAKLNHHFASIFMKLGSISHLLFLICFPHGLLLYLDTPIQWKKEADPYHEKVHIICMHYYKLIFIAGP